MSVCDVYGRAQRNAHTHSRKTKNQEQKKVQAFIFNEQ